MNTNAGLPQTSFEAEHDIEAGAPLTKAEVLRETPEQTEERMERDIEFGRRAPRPEDVDQEKSTVSAAQVAAVEQAAFQPHHPEKDADDEKKSKKAAKKTASHSHKK